MGRKGRECVIFGCSGGRGHLIIGRNGEERRLGVEQARVGSGRDGWAGRDGVGGGEVDVRAEGGKEGCVG